MAKEIRNILLGLVFTLVGIGMYMLGMENTQQWMCVVGMTICGLSTATICYSAYKKTYLK